MEYLRRLQEKRKEKKFAFVRELVDEGKFVIDSADPKDTTPIWQVLGDKEPTKIYPIEKASVEKDIPSHHTPRHIPTTIFLYNPFMHADIEIIRNTVNGLSSWIKSKKNNASSTEETADR